MAKKKNASPSIRKMPRRTKEFELNGDYQGWKFTAVTSFPTKFLSYIQTSNMHLIASILGEIIVSWNFVDYDGNPLPQPTEKYPALDTSGEPVLSMPDVEDGKVVEGTGGKPIFTTAIFELPPDLMWRVVDALTSNLGDVDAP